MRVHGLVVRCIGNRRECVEDVPSKSLMAMCLLWHSVTTQATALHGHIDSQTLRIQLQIHPCARMRTHWHILTANVDDLDTDQRRAMSFQAQHRAASSQVPANGLVLETEGRMRLVPHVKCSANKPSQKRKNRQMKQITSGDFSSKLPIEQESNKCGLADKLINQLTA